LRFSTKALVPSAAFFVCEEKTAAWHEGYTVQAPDFR
jgi:hypothetical protein